MGPPAGNVLLALAPLLCLVTYWRGLSAWFIQDDFVWLGLRLQVHNWIDLFCAVFMPSEPNPFRPGSERLFFLSFSRIFGPRAFPFRVWVFLTQFANLALKGSIVRMTTGSRWAGLLTAILCIVNAGLVLVMTWTPAYMQVLCCFVRLTGFYFLLLYIQRGERRSWMFQWMVFLLGLGVLETNVVHPVLAAAYTLCCLGGGLTEITRDYRPPQGLPEAQARRRLNARNPTQAEYAGPR